MVAIALAALGVAACGSVGANGAAKATGPHRTSSCEPPSLTLFGPRPARPKAPATPLPAKILSSFSVLRRSADPSESAARAGVAARLAKEYELSSYYPAYVRQLARLPGGRRYFVVPAFARSRALPPPTCLPASQRADRPKLLEQQQRRGVETVYCLVEVRTGPSPAIGCEPFAAIDESVRVFNASDFIRQPIVELAPDGVSSVRITYRGRAPIVVPIKENAFWFTPPASPPSRVDSELKRLLHKLLAGRLTNTQQRTLTTRWNNLLRKTDPTKIEWLNSVGGLIRTIKAPTSASYGAISVGDVRAPIEG